MLRPANRYAPTSLPTRTPATPLDLGYDASESYGIAYKARGLCKDLTNLDIYDDDNGLNYGVTGNIKRSQLHHNVRYALHGMCRGRHSAFWLHTIVPNGVSLPRSYASLKGWMACCVANHVCSPASGHFVML